jgi:hypothetical protein
MRITSEEQLLDQGIRAKIIEEIEGSENKRRKDEHYKRYQSYKDKTYLYVIKQLLRQFDPGTVNEMSYAISNIAFVRKVIDKLARVYKYGVTREAIIGDKKDDATTEAIDKITNKIDFNAAIKKTNRFFKLHKNVAFYICPKKTTLEENSKKTIKAFPLLPFLYDVIEMAEDREKPAAFILSDYEAEDTDGMLYSLNPGVHRSAPRVMLEVESADGKDQIIADAPADQRSVGGVKKQKYYIFWSGKYHFTCDSKGSIVSGDDILNPIAELPFENFAEDQDGSFWASGGDDLTDGAVLVNSLISNINHIAVTQGYGQLVMTGNNLPRNQKVGPNKAVLLEYDAKAGDTAPTFEFKTANPPLDQLRSLVEMYVALLLTTNNLTTSGVASNLNGGAQFPSGIAMLIDRSESMEDVADQRQVFVDGEPRIWKKIAKWHEVLKTTGELEDDLRKLSFGKDFTVSLKFEHPEVVQTEKEQLEVLKLKKEMGIVTMLDILKTEYPELTEPQLEEKLKDILKEKMEAMSRAINQSVGSEGNQGGELVKPGAGAPEESPSGNQSENQK